MKQVLYQGPKLLGVNLHNLVVGATWRLEIVHPCHYYSHPVLEQGPSEIRRYIVHIYLTLTLLITVRSVKQTRKVKTIQQHTLLRCN